MKNRMRCAACNGTGYFEAAEPTGRYGDETEDGFFMADEFGSSMGFMAESELERSLNFAAVAGVVGASSDTAGVGGAVSVAVSSPSSVRREFFRRNPKRTEVQDIAMHAMSLDEMLIANKNIRYQGVSAFSV